MRNWAEMWRASNAEIFTWAGKQFWAEDMRRCQQDAQWHAEGDVWTHTGMVFREVEALEGYGSLERSDQLLLLFTALLHDAGKPATTAIDPETGRTRSLNHSLVGAVLARTVLRELGCDLAWREQLVNLVRYHGRPPYLLEKPAPEKEVIRLSWLLSNKLLYLFALADTRGRDADGGGRPEETLHLWRDVSVEHDCFDRPYSFASDEARFLFYRNALNSLHYMPHEEARRATVTMMSGLPGSGKDTWLARHRPGLPVVSLDAVRGELEVDATDNQGAVIQRAREHCREHLRIKADFAFNATNISMSQRKRWIDLCADYGARVEIVYLEPPLATILKRNREREANVPEKVMQRLIEKIEVPTITEAHAVTLAGEE